MPTSAINEVAKSDMLDRAIAITIVLFILSMISERFVTWVKVYWGKLGKKLPGFSVSTEDLTIPSDNPLREKRREQKILGLNIVLSILIAFVAHANLFEIINSPVPYDSLGWSNISLCCEGSCIAYFFNSLIGCMLCGLFISLGSKFWHDTLDMLLETKNLKRKLVDNQTYAFEKVDDISNYTQLKQKDIYELLHKENKTTIWDDPNVIAVEMQFVNNAIQLFLRVLDLNHKFQQMTKASYFLSNGTKVYVPVVIVKNDEVTTYGSYYPSDLIMNGAVSGVTKPNRGSLGCMVRRGTADYLLTCYHVVKPPLQDWEKFDTAKGNIDVKGFLNLNKDELLGSISEGGRDQYYDYALIKPDNTANTFNPQIPNVGSINATRYIYGDDITKRTLVAMKGGVTSNISHGRITGYPCSVDIKYKDSPKHKLNNLISITSSNGIPFSKEGDSGSLVFAADERVAVGIIVAGNKEVSYMMPIQDLFDMHKLKLV